MNRIVTFEESFFGNGSIVFGRKDSNDTHALNSYV